MPAVAEGCGTTMRYVRDALTLVLLSERCLLLRSASPTIDSAVVDDVAVIISELNGFERVSCTHCAHPHPVLPSSREMAKAGSGRYAYAL